MLRRPLILLVAALVPSPSLAVLAQNGAGPAKTASTNADDIVRGAPYSAERRFTSVSIGADGKDTTTESGGSEARDSQGRTYSAGERQWMYQGVLKSEMLY